MASDDSQNNSNSLASRLISCPRCRKSTRYDQGNPYRPFCSARCKNDDIISWAEESYRVPGKPVLDPDELELQNQDGEPEDGEQ